MCVCVHVCEEEGGQERVNQFMVVNLCSIILVMQTLEEN